MRLTHAGACNECVANNAELKISETNYFVYINLKEQLKQTLLNHWDEIQAYNSVMNNDDCQEITHTYSGTLIQENLQKNNRILSLMINTDGVSLKKSNKKSVWLIQIICNFLPPQLRYLKENLITVAFSYLDEKPSDMRSLFKPLANEMEDLELNGFVFRNEVFRTAVTSAILDLPAKASFQQTMQYNGFFGCGFCLHPGKKFDMVRSFGLDYMHCVCLGVSRSLMQFWFDSKLDHASYMKKRRKISWINV